MDSVAKRNMIVNMIPVAIGEKVCSSDSLVYLTIDMHLRPYRSQTPKILLKLSLTTYGVMCKFIAAQMSSLKWFDIRKTTASSSLEAYDRWPSLMRDWFSAQMSPPCQDFNKWLKFRIMDGGVVCTLSHFVSSNSQWDSSQLLTFAFARWALGCCLTDAELNHPLILECEEIAGGSWIYDCNPHTIMSHPCSTEISVLVNGAENLLHYYSFTCLIPHNLQIFLLIKRSSSAIPPKTTASSSCKTTV